MSSERGQSQESMEPATGSSKRRRKPEEGPGKVFRDFLQRTGLNDDLEEFVAQVARRGINNLCETFTPVDGRQPIFNPPPGESSGRPKNDNHDDPYVVLGVHRNTPPEIMKAVYLAWAKHHHPDVGGDAEPCKRVNMAWDQIKAARGL